MEGDGFGSWEKGEGAGFAAGALHANWELNPPSRTAGAEADPKDSEDATPLYRAGAEPCAPSLAPPFLSLALPSSPFSFSAAQALGGSSNIMSYHIISYNLI